MQFPDAFTIDERYDRVHAGDRRSRFGAYLTRRTFLDVDDEPTSDPAWFAIMALETALPPVMSPPYVAPHRRILRVRGHRDDDCRGAVAVDLAASLPTAAAQLLSWRWRGWNTDGNLGHYYPPADNDRPIALCRLSLRVPLTAQRLPEPRYRADGTPHVGIAKEAVQLAALQLNGALGELLAALHCSVR